MSNAQTHDINVPIFCTHNSHEKCLHQKGENSHRQCLNANGSNSSKKECVIIFQNLNWPNIFIV